MRRDNNNKVTTGQLIIMGNWGSLIWGLSQMLYRMVLGIFPSEDKKLCFKIPHWSKTFLEALTSLHIQATCTQAGQASAGSGEAQRMFEWVLSRCLELSTTDVAEIRSGLKESDTGL